MAWSKTTWVDFIGPYVNAEWLNSLEDWIEDADADLVGMDTTITNLDTASQSHGASITALQAQVTALGNGAPTPVTTAAEMTDTTKAYLYTGSEAGYTAGDWYYYNGTAWTDGGQYGAEAATASEIIFDNSSSGLSSTDVQSAIEEVVDLIGDADTLLGTGVV